MTAMNVHVDGTRNHDQKNESVYFYGADLGLNNVVRSYWIETKSCISQFLIHPNVLSLHQTKKLIS